VVGALAKADDQVGDRWAITLAAGEQLVIHTQTPMDDPANSPLNDLNPSWSARLSFSYPLFNGFSRELQMTRSAVTREATYAEAEDARRQVTAQLTQYLAALVSARTRLEIAEANRAASEEDVRVQRERYRLGAATIVDVLASQVNLDQAEVDIVQARFDFLVAKAQIEALVGREL